MAVQTVYPLSRNGDSKAYAAGASGGDTVPNDGRTFLHFKNSSGGSITVTIASVQPCNQGQTHNETVVVGATTGDEMAGPFDVSRFSGTLALTYSANPPTGLTLAALTLGT